MEAAVKMRKTKKDIYQLLLSISAKLDPLLLSDKPRQKSSKCAVKVVY